MKIHRGIVAAAIIFAVASTLAVAQEAPKPGPEHKKLEYFVGKWKTEGEMKPNPFMPGGKFTGTDDCEWFEGGFAVICHTDGTGPMGSAKGLAIMSYSPEHKAYTYYGTDSTGMTMTSVPLGTIDGKTWVYDDESMMGGTMIKNRYTIVVTSETSYTFKWELQDPDGTWMAIMEGKAKKS